MIGGFLGLGMAGEGEAGGFEVDINFGDIGGGDCEIDVVLLGVT